MKIRNLIILGVLVVALLGAIWIFFYKNSLKESELNVIEKITDIGQIEKVIEIAQNDCSSYRDFIKNNQQYRKPISETELQKQIEDAKDYIYAHPSGKVTENLKEKIIQELNIGFLLDGLNQRELIVTTIATYHHREFIEKELLFKDPQVGDFFVLLLIPRGKRKLHPAIIGLHGHGGYARRFKDSFFGEELAKEGFVVIMPTFRAMNYDRTEMVISKELYLNGFTLMGLRVYEVLLLTKYLKYKDFVDEHKIGIMAHSAGSSVTCLICNINPSNFQAAVYDVVPNNLDWLCGMFHCEVIPKLACYDSQIYNYFTLNVPTQMFEYEYPNPSDKREVIAFFKEKLVGGK